MKKKLIFHLIRMYGRILHSCLCTFGLGLWFLYFLFKIPITLVFIHFTMFLDNIFFPGYRKVKIEKPVIIIGHPRSATTFLHSILTQTEDFVVFKGWELNIPSLTIRKFLQHFKTLQVFSYIFDYRFTPHKLKRIFQDKKKGKVIGETFQQEKQKLGKILQEEEVLFLHTLDTQFLPLMTPLGFVREGYLELCYNDEQPHQEKSVKFLQDCFKRQIYYTGKKQIIAKLNFSLFRIKTLLKYFPDAKIIYLVRSPLDTVPSHLSLHRRILDRYFGLDNIPPERLQQYYEHRYNYNILFYKQFEKLMDNHVFQNNQLMVISYDSLKNELWSQIKRVKEFTNLEFHSDLESRLKKHDQKQSSYRRKHDNLPIEAFGFTEERIMADFDFVFKKYGF